MVAANQITVGMSLAIGKDVYQVEQATRVSGASKSTHFVKAKLRNLCSGEVIEKNFKPTQEIDEVVLEAHMLEFLYTEGDMCLFLDTNTLELTRVPESVVGHKMYYLKEGIAVKALCYKNSAFSVELPQFLELMVSSVESNGAASAANRGTRVAVLETGAKIVVPLFIDVGDIIKIDPESKEYIQRV